METSQTNKRNVQVYVTNHESTTTTITVETPIETGDPLLDSAQTRSIPPRSNTLIEIPPSLMASGMYIERKGIAIKSSGGLLSVSILNQQSDGCGAFKVIPYDSLGYNYYTLSVWPVNPENSMSNQIGILATEDGSNVSVTLPSSAGISFQYNGVTYNGSVGFNTLTITMNAYDTLQLRDSAFADMSRVKVSSNKRVAVFTGVQKIDVGVPEAQSDSATDSLTEQMLPLHSAGKNFVLIPFNDISRYFFQIMSTIDYTMVTYGDISEVITKAPGLLKGELTEAGKPMFIKATEPIFVALVYPSREISTEGGPSMVMVPPIGQYRFDYTFSLPYSIFGYAYQNTLMISIAKGFQSGLLLDGQQVNPSNWVDVQYSTPEMVTTSILVSQIQTRRLYHSGNRTFGLVIYGYEPNARCRYVLQGGGCLDNLQLAVSISVAASEP